MAKRYFSSFKKYLPILFLKYSILSCVHLRLKSLVYTFQEMLFTSLQVQVTLSLSLSLLNTFSQHLSHSPILTRKFPWFENRHRLLFFPSSFHVEKASARMNITVDREERGKVGGEIGKYRQIGSEETNIDKFNVKAVKRRN